MIVFFTQSSFSVFSKASKVYLEWNSIRKRDVDEVDVRSSQVLHTFQNINIPGFVVFQRLGDQGEFQHSTTRCPENFASIFSSFLVFTSIWILRIRCFASEHWITGCGHICNLDSMSEKYIRYVEIPLCGNGLSDTGFQWTTGSTRTKILQSGS